MINRMHKPDKVLTIGGSVIAAALLVGAFNAGGAEAGSTPRPGDVPGVASWAEANGLSGLAPTSVKRPDGPNHGLGQIRAWARENGLTGLSPASLRAPESAQTPTS